MRLPDQESNARTTRISRHALEEDRPVAPQVYLLAYHRDGAEVASLRAGEVVVVGREAPSTTVIRDPSLSREHARFVLDGGEVVVEDLGSTNGTWMGQDRVDKATLGVGGEVQLGGVRVSVLATPSSERALGLDSHDRFRTTLEDELCRARHFGRSLAVLTVRSARAGSHVSRFSQQVRAALQVFDRVGLFSADTLEIICPEVSLERAQEIGRAIVAAAPEGAPVFVGVAGFPGSSLKAEELCELSGEAARLASASAPVCAAPSSTWSSSEDRGEPLVVSKAMRRVFETVDRVGRAPITVLIQGETGTGKEVVARALHAASPRAKLPMIVVNCGAIPQNLVESTLFGHVKGAFTGAFQDQKGVFEAANGSTLFLDEIGELSPAAQAALLRVLELGCVTRIGSAREIQVDVRVIAATHRDLEALCKSGGFRPDLFFRLDAMTIWIPPLRERMEEIDPLVERFLRQTNLAAGTRVRGVHPDALALLKRYDWQGNVRELRNAIHRAAVNARGDEITEEELPDRVRRAGARAPRQEERRAEAVVPPDGLKEALRRSEIQIILAALAAADDNQTEAAKLLKVPLRTLAHKIKALGIRRGGFGASR